MATPIPVNHAPVTARDAAAATGGALVRSRDAEATARGVTTDSRAVAAGGVFVALRGERFDGHDFLEQAEAQGAALVIVERGQASRVTRADVVEVDDTLLAWGALARAHLERWRRSKVDGRRVIAITGSAGKTTTKELVRALASLGGDCHATAGNLNNRIGLPAVLLGLEPSHDRCVLEMGMSVRGEIAQMARIAPPDVAVITNVGLAHAGGVGGTRDDVAREKGALFEALHPSGAAIVCADDSVAQAQLERTRASDVRRFGRADSAGYRLVQRVVQGARARVTIHLPGRGPETFDTPLVGEAPAIDLCAAIAAVEALAQKPLESEKIHAALVSLSLPGRQAFVSLHGDVLAIDDTYNANPQSYRAALGLLLEVAAERRKIAVFGEMKELGDVAEQEHLALGQAMGRAGVALVVGCGGALVARGLEAARAHGARTIACDSSELAGRALVSEIADGDVVLFKGSRGAETERALSVIVHARGVVEESG